MEWFDAERPLHGTLDGEAERLVLARRLPLGAGAAKQPFVDMRSLATVCLGRAFGTAAPGQLRTLECRSSLQTLGIGATGAYAPWRRTTLCVDLPSSTSLSAFHAFVDRPGGRSTCRWFGHPVDVAVRCARPGGEHLRSQRDRGCAFWEREPVSDD
jgi:hypothetical protein